MHSRDQSLVAHAWTRSQKFNLCRPSTPVPFTGLGHAIPHHIDTANCCQACDNGNLPVVKMLLEKGAKLTVDGTRTKSDDCYKKFNYHTGRDEVSTPTPVLHGACSAGHLEVVRFWSTPSLLMSMRFANVACRRCKKPLTTGTPMLSSF